MEYILCEITCRNYNSIFKDIFIFNGYKQAIYSFIRKFKEHSQYNYEEDINDCI